MRVIRGPWGVGDGGAVWAGLVLGKNRTGRGEGGGWWQGIRKEGSVWVPSFLLGSPAAGTRQLRHGGH